MKPLIIGTRGSHLALWQANHVKKLIENCGAYSCTIEIIKTRGDSDLTTPLPEIGSKGFFTEELEQALRGHKIDFAVHSMKDLPVELDADLDIGAVPERGAAMDAMVIHENKKFPEKGDNVIIATGSNRRKVHLKNIFPNAETVDVRGNIHTRLRKMKTENWDGIIMAETALNRLGLNNIRRHVFSIDEMIPAAGQGAIAVQICRDRKDLTPILQIIDHTDSHLAVHIEREIIRILEGGCKVPAGAFAKLTGNDLSIDAFIATFDLTKMIRIKKQGLLEHRDELLSACIQEFEEKGAKDIILENREEVFPN